MTSITTTPALALAAAAVWLVAGIAVTAWDFRANRHRYQAPTTPAALLTRTGSFALLTLLWPFTLTATRRALA